MGCVIGGKNPQNDPLDKKNSLRLRDQAPKNEYKVTLLGDAAVGKSSIANRYRTNTFQEHYDITIAGAYVSSNVALRNGTGVKLHIWDTGGEERFRGLASFYYKDAHACLLVYDVMSVQSFHNLDYWIKEVDTCKKNDNLLIYIVANKSDAPPEDKKVSSEMGKQLAESTKAIFMETSAKTGYGVSELFTTVAENLHRVFGVPNPSQTQQQSISCTMYT
eukprot:TRINITY_DN11161_c0_g1_i2.p1 TRINITY_DN11161_c0_g1~~TRINITY_DN11161_c0_g1_i2.p1  ORF type:complete len:219 (+),score=7.31 TRINITY_DN11161_c0_g1_i2:135-791(+)